LIISAASELYGFLNLKKKSIEITMDRLSKFMKPENEELLISQDF